MAEVIDFSLVFSVPVVMGVGRVAGRRDRVCCRRKERQGRDGWTRKGLNRVEEVGLGWVWGVRRKGVAQDK